MSVTSAQVANRVARPPATWIHSARRDLTLALCWVPFAAVGMALGSRAGAVQWFAAAVLLLSLAHQPVTLALEASASPSSCIVLDRVVRPSRR